MKASILLCAGAFALLLSPGAIAKSGSAGAQAHRHATHKSVRPAKTPRAPKKDPWAAYWNDASRYEFPSWSYRGGW